MNWRQDTMKVAHDESDWVGLAKNNQLAQAFEIYSKLRRLKVRLTHFGYWLTLYFGPFIVDLILRRLTRSFGDLDVDLSDEYLLFYRKIDVVGVYLLPKILGFAIREKKAPVRALIWFSHWLVFQGHYRQALPLFRRLNLLVPNEIRMRCELDTFTGNYFYVRGLTKRADRYHRRAHDCATIHSDRIILTFNFGQWIRISAVENDLEHLLKVLAAFDDINPSEPDERYGLRVLVFCAYVYFASGNYNLASHFLTSAENLYHKTGSDLERAIFNTVSAIIGLQSGNILSARKSLTDARYHLKRFGRYSFYEDLVDALIILSSENPTASARQERRFRIHKTIGSFFKADHSSTTVKVPRQIDLQMSQDKVAHKFYSESLKIFESYSELTTEQILSSIKTQTGATELNYTSNESAENQKDHIEILNKPNATEIKFSLRTSAEFLEITLLTPFLKWRNPEVLDAIRSILLSLQAIAAKEAEKQTSGRREIARQLAETAAQVSHDIRSPLSALNMIVSALTEVDESKRNIIRHATQRINDIANDLLERSRQSSLNKAEIGRAQNAEGSNLSVELVPHLVDLLVSEKRMQYRDRSSVEIELDARQAYGSFARLKSNELKRAISNLVNNSVEAISTEGKVTVQVSQTLSSVTISVLDNGRGIPESLMDRLGEKGFTYGKSESGTGLGIFYAKSLAENLGGRFRIQSKEGEGTLVSMTFPRTLTPEWYLDALELATNTTLVCIDDDSSVHEIWRSRLDNEQARKCNVQLRSFKSPGEFADWFQSKPDGNYRFLVDYEFLNQPITGLDLIENLGIWKSSSLLTSRYEKPEIRARAQSLKIKIAPKEFSSQLPVRLGESHI